MLRLSSAGFLHNLGKSGIRLECFSDLDEKVWKNVFIFRLWSLSFFYIHLSVYPYCSPSILLLCWSVCLSVCPWLITCKICRNPDFVTSCLKALENWLNFLCFAQTCFPFQLQLNCLYPFISLLSFHSLCEGGGHRKITIIIEDPVAGWQCSLPVLPSFWPHFTLP